MDLNETIIPSFKSTYNSSSLEPTLGIELNETSEPSYRPSYQMTTLPTNDPNLESTCIAEKKGCVSNSDTETELVCCAGLECIEKNSKWKCRQKNN